MPAGTPWSPGTTRPVGSTPAVGAVAVSKTRLLVRRQNARILGRVLARAEGLHVVKNIGERSIQFPAQTVIQRYGWSQLPAVLREQIDACAAHVLALRRALGVAVGECRADSRDSCRCSWTAFEVEPSNVELAAHVVIKSLVKARAADVGAKLELVISLDPSQIVRPHERVSHLRQFALPAVADGESTRDVHEGNACVIARQAGRNAGLGRICQSTQ